MLQPQLVKTHKSLSSEKERNGLLSARMAKIPFLLPIRKVTPVLGNPCNLAADRSMVDLSSNVPPTLIVPSYNGTKPITAFSKEVFPQPDCPTIQAVSPFSISFQNRKKRTSVPKAIQALLICNMAFLILSFRQRYYFLEKRYLCLTN